MEMKPGAGGLGARLRAGAGAVLAILHTRLELLSTEIQEEQVRVRGLFLYGVAALFLLGFGLLFLALFLTVLLWDSQRLLALGVFTALFLAGGTASAVIVARLARQGSRLFEASLAELTQDREALSESE